MHRVSRSDIENALFIKNENRQRLLDVFDSLTASHQPADSEGQTEAACSATFEKKAAYWKFRCLLVEQLKDCKDSGTTYNLHRKWLEVKDEEPL